LLGVGRNSNNNGGFYRERQLRITPGMTRGSTQRNLVQDGKENSTRTLTCAVTETAVHTLCRQPIKQGGSIGGKKKNQGRENLPSSKADSKETPRGKRRSIEETISGGKGGEQKTVETWKKKKTQKIKPLVFEYEK